MPPKAAAKAPEIVLRDPNTLTPHANNARTHTAEQIEQIARSLTEFGWTNPVLIAKDKTIIAGHGRIAAALQLGMKQVPTLILAGLTEAQIRAYVIADNKLALNAGWDESLLKLEMEMLRDSGFDIGIVGFSPDELQVIFEGWDSTITPPPDGESDPTVGKIVVTCAVDDVDSLTAALKRAAIDRGFAGVEFK